MSTSVCFILGELSPSGGAGAVVWHARGLAERHGCDVSIVVDDPHAAPAPPGTRLVSLDEARAREHDVAIATWWRTVYDLFSIPARRRAYFVQQLEERVYRPGDPERLGAAVTHDLPLAFVTEARWIADELEVLHPEAACFHVPNGIDKDCFAPGRRERGEGPLRVLVEGSPDLWFKGVEEAADTLALAREPLATTLVAPQAVAPAIASRFDRVAGPLAAAEMAAAYRDADVLLKLSRVEGVFTPPLEAFHCGTPCVVWPVTGHDEYVRHGVNGAVADFDDLAGTAGWIDLLARDRALLARLGEGALATAAEWPSWERSTAGFAAAIAAIAATPTPPAGAGVARLLADVDAAMEAWRGAALRQRWETERAEAELAVSERRVDGAIERLNAIEGSAAWRLAAPLRRLVARRR